MVIRNVVQSNVVKSQRPKSITISEHIICVNTPEDLMYRTSEINRKMCPKTIRNIPVRSGYAAVYKRNLYISS